MMGETGGVSDRNREFERGNRVNGGSFGHVEYEVMVKSQSRDMLGV